MRMHFLGKQEKIKLFSKKWKEITGLFLIFLTFAFIVSKINKGISVTKNIFLRFCLFKKMFKCCN